MALRISVAVAVVSIAYSTGSVMSDTGVLIENILGKDNALADSMSSLPVSGFVKATKDQTPITFKIINIVDGSPFCNRIEFVNQPSPNTSPFAGPPQFYIKYDQLVNDHFHWTNGIEILSYIKYPDSDYGNWLIGNTAGVDNGYVYFKTTEKSILPVGMESSDNHWHWLMEGKWKEVPAMRAVCTDSFNISSSQHYNIEYFDPDTHEVHHSYMVQSMSPFVFATQQGLVDKEEDYDGASSVLKPTAAYFDKSASKWTPLENLQTIARFGYPALITQKGAGKQQSDVAILVKDEHGGNNGWRLSFRKYPLPSSTPGAVKTTRPYEQHEEEHLIEVSSAGTAGGFTISNTLTATANKEYQRVLQQSVDAIQIHDYVWLWYADILSDATHRAATHEVLLKFIAQNTVPDSSGGIVTTRVFEYYETDRQDVMKQTVLSRDSDHFVLKTTTTAAGKSTTATLKGKAVRFQSLVRIGSDVLSFLRTHLVNKEGRPNGMSSCYLYHAAVSMPQVLVYAAEILCVLIGAKPLTMIQYTSPTEHQWKFPLIRELTQSITANKQLLGAALDVDYQVFRYRSDETLVVYRTGRQYVADALQPMGRQAQALHPLPYPDTSRLNADHKLQIYYAAWNGHLLGYPEYFVDSYCETFHNALDVVEKKRQARAGKADFLKHMKAIQKEPFQIKMGLDTPISEAHFELIVNTTLRLR